jgi:Uma2 family endonuclease
VATATYQPPRYALRDYLHWEGDWELWDGQAVAMAPSPGFYHQEVGANLVAVLREQLRSNRGCGDCHLAYEVDWHVDDHTVVRPDVVIVCGDRPGRFIERPPAFVAEILSAATAEKDRTAKRALYQAEGVKVYLIIDPEARSCELLGLGPGRLYTPLDPGSQVELHDGCRIRFDPGVLW